MMLYLIFILLSIKGIKSQQYQWHCSAFDSSSNRFSLPDLEVENHTLVQIQGLKNQVQPSSVGVSYIYPVLSAQVNCSGTVKSIEYCYVASGSGRGLQNHIFTLSTLDQNGTSFSVLDSVPVSSESTSGKCIYSSQGSSMYCCNKKVLIEMDEFQIPSANFAFGITIPITAYNVLLKYSSKEFDSYIVEHYCTGTALTAGTTLVLGNVSRVTNQALHLLQFLIEPNSTATTEQTSNTPPEQNTDEFVPKRSFTPNGGLLATGNLPTTELPICTGTSDNQAGSIEICIPVPNTSTPGLNTITIASIAVVGGLALLIAILCMVSLTIAIAKKRKNSAIATSVINSTSTMQDNPLYETTSDIDVTHYGLQASNSGYYDIVI